MPHRSVTNRRICDPVTADHATTLKGNVLDQAGCPVEGAKVFIDGLSDDGRRLGFGGRPGAAEERLRGSQVPPLTQQYVDHLAILIDGTVEVPLDGAMEEEDLVDVPTAAKPTTMPPGRSCELWTEGLGPGEHGPR